MKQPQDKIAKGKAAKGTSATSKAPEGRQATASVGQPARMPKPPKRPTPEQSDAAMRSLDGDDQERRDAAKAYLESEHASARLGMDVPDLPRKSPDPSH